MSTSLQTNTDNNYNSELSKKVLKEAINKHTLVGIYLKNGIKLEGQLVGFNNHALFLTPNFTPDILQMIYKHAISTIMFAPTGYHST